MSDDEVLAAAQRAMSKRGPHELRLADIAEEAGLTPGRLVQRYGSKRELLAALSERFAGSAGEVFAGLRAAHRNPLAVLRAYAACMAELAPTPEALLRNLAYLQADLANDVLHAHLVANAHATRQEIQALLRESVAAGELKRGTNVRSLARTVEAVISGALMTWATYREGEAAAWIRREVDAVLAPYRPRPRAARKKPPGRNRPRPRANSG